MAFPEGFPRLGRPEIQSMREFGMSLDSPTRTYSDLAELRDHTLREEIAGSRKELEELPGYEVCCLAYPYWRFDERALAIARNAAYRAAFSVNAGFNRPGFDRNRIRRLDVHGTGISARLLRRVALGNNDSSWLSSARYCASGLRGRLAPAERPK